MAKQTKVVKKRKVKVEAIGEAHIQASFNNIIISLTNKNGEVISWSSAGKMGFRGSKKNTPFAAQMAAENCSSVAYEAGLRRVKVFVKGPGAGRESAIRSIHNSGIEVSEIEVVPILAPSFSFLSIMSYFLLFLTDINCFPIMQLIKVLFPPPVAPTRATVVPALICN